MYVQLISPARWCVANNMPGTSRSKSTPRRRNRETHSLNILYFHLLTLCIYLPFSYVSTHFFMYSSCGFFFSFLYCTYLFPVVAYLFILFKVFFDEQLTNFNIIRYVNLLISIQLILYLILRQLEFLSPSQNNLNELN